jgi:hypothetical protein
MFNCISCRRAYTLDDVMKGRYYPSTSVCLQCYQDMAKSKTTCFGSDLYDRKAMACQACPDRQVCSVFVQHPHDSRSER